jgi:NodT family efflux transporter outer membrane factor (OMF) lipoprotein
MVQARTIGLIFLNRGGCCALRIACLIPLLLSGCGLSQWAHNGFQVGPNYCPPRAAVAESWIDVDESQVAPCLPDFPQWWAVFEDPVLNDLVRTAYEQNPSLREAGWRVMQARARRSISAGNLFPQAQQGFGDYERILNSENIALPAPLREFDAWSSGLSLSWELDVWGRFRRSIASADADLQASIGDYDAILLSLIAEVATAYADYRTFQQRLEYARHNVGIQKGSLELTQDKADEGATGYTSVHLAKSSLESTQAGIPTLEIGLRQSANRLCTLLGVPTQDLTEILGEGNIPSTPSEVAVGIPLDLMRRRPDIRAAERSIAAQSEQIGIAISDLYPHFSINGEIALESEEFSDLFSSASTAGSIGPSFRWNLLNYGRIINNVQLQAAGLQELIAGYQNTVLTANQEVEDAMVGFLRSQQRVRFLESSVAETEEALRLLTISFEDGAISFTGVFVMQQQLVVRQDQLATARGDVVTSLIEMYKALGGGWEIRCRGSGIVEPTAGAPTGSDPIPEMEVAEPIPTPAGVLSQPPGVLEIDPSPDQVPPLLDPSDGVEL